MKTTRCFINGVEAPCPSDAVVKKSDELGAELWRELHLWSLKSDPSAIEINAFWFLNWERRVFSIFGTGCLCWQHWQIIKRKLPVELDNLFDWSVRAHNEVNAILGKPFLSLEEAIRIFSSVSDSFVLS